MYTVEIKLKRLHPKARLPVRATVGSACYDLATVDWGEIGGNESKVWSTGWEVEVPVDYMLELRPRSGLAARGIQLANSPATLDLDYRGEVKVILYNANPYPVQIAVGDRIAQMRVVELIPTTLCEVEELSPTERDTGGLGSTGD